MERFPVGSGQVKKKGRTTERGPLELIEEATRLARRMPVAVLARYYLGTLPFAIGALYFWSEMTRSAFAGRAIADWALAMAVLYVWMKAWQASFCGRTKALLADAPPVRKSAGQVLRLCLQQTAVQPFSFIALPVAALLTLPFGWAYAFFHNLSLFGDGTSPGVKMIYRRAYRQALVYPRQNHLLIGTLMVFGTFVFLNALIGLYLVPSLLKSFFGVESAFTRSGLSGFNSTLTAAAFAVSYLVVNPLAKIAYVLRCFYGEALESGEDLRIDLLRAGAARALSLFLIGAAAWLLSSGFEVLPAVAAEIPPPPPQQQSALSPADLDRSLSDTIAKRDYAWRLPRPETKGEPKGPFAAFMESVIDTVRDWLATLWQWIRDAAEWLAKHLRRLDQGSTSSGIPLNVTPEVLLAVLLVLVAGVLLVVLYKIRKRQPTAGLTGEAVAPMPDLTSEDVTADQLPTGGWFDLAARLIAQGELRLGLRALYLGSLSQLAERGMLTIARYKSNREYAYELQRRAGASAELPGLFDVNMRVFESIWYGTHAVTAETVRDFRRNHERMSALAEKR